MPISLAKLSQSQQNFVDVPCPGEDEPFRIHRLGLTDFLSLRPLLQEIADNCEVDGDGTADSDEIADRMGDKLTPIVCKSLGGDWDSADGIAYMNTRADLLLPLFNALVSLHMKGLGETNPETEAKND